MNLARLVLFTLLAVPLAAQSADRLAGKNVSIAQVAYQGRSAVPSDRRRSFNRTGHHLRQVNQGRIPQLTKRFSRSRPSVRPQDRLGPAYQSSFKPNWICRDVVDVDVITPAVDAGGAVADENTTVFGVPKFA